MATLTTKYSVGDVVYFASTTTEQKQHPCPDCLGAREWTATSPAGASYTFRCPRCATRYHSDHDLCIDYTAHVPLVTRLTIGSIQVNTAPGSWNTGAQYMAIETGVGSGSLYREASLFATEAEALEAATRLAKELDQSIKWVAKLYDKSLEISDYQLGNAALKKAADRESRARSMLYNIGDLFSRIEEASDKDAILEAIEEYRTYDWERDKAKADEEPTP